MLDHPRRRRRCRTGHRHGARGERRRGHRRRAGRLDRRPARLAQARGRRLHLQSGGDDPRARAGTDRARDPAGGRPDLSLVRLWPPARASPRGIARRGRGAAAPSPARRQGRRAEHAARRRTAFRRGVVRRRAPGAAAGDARRAVAADRCRGRRGRSGRMRADRRACRAPPAQRRQVRPRLVARRADQGLFRRRLPPQSGADPRSPRCFAATVHLRDDLGEGSSGDAEWLALLHALDVARRRGRNATLVLLGDSASVIDQAKGVARRASRSPTSKRASSTCVGRFDRVRFRRIKRSQNLAGIALEQVHRRRPQP